MGEAKLDDETCSVTHGPGQTRRRGMVGEHDRLGKPEVGFAGSWANCGLVVFGLTTIVARVSKPVYGSVEEGSANLFGCRSCTEAVAGSFTHGPRMGRLWVGRTEPSLGRSH
jgi:hypothetical protein